VSLREDIEALVAHEGRVAGSDAERRAAQALRRRLSELGREADIQPLSVFPAWHLTHALHALLGIVGSLIAVAQPVVGSALVLVALVSILGDVTGAFHLVRRLTGRRASQNVVSPGGTDAPGTLVLVAHYDAGRSGYVFGRRRLPLPPFLPLALATAVVLFCTVLRSVGVEGTLLTLVQFIPTVVLVLHLPLLVDITLSEPVPGANDNASGVAIALQLAERHGTRLENYDLWVVFTGAQESFALGMREFLRVRRRELDPRTTLFINLDELGQGRMRFSRREGLLFGQRTHPQLRELCEQLAEDDPDAGAQGVTLRAASDAGAALVRRLPAITLTARPTPQHHQPGDVPEALDDEALERNLAYCSQLIERIDQSLPP
jgi:hypothetical protein